MTRDQVKRYYDDSVWDYLLFWTGWEAPAMHYGYWDETVRSHNAALIRLNAVVAERLGLNPKMRVLDAGCGLGGTSFWLAQNVGCKVTGITISPRQVYKASEFSRKLALSEQVDFQVMDYMRTSFPDASFDAVVAIETICHLDDKTPFYKEMFRILKPGGRLLVADFVAKKEKYSPHEARNMHLFLSGWAVSETTWTLADHLQGLQKAGFVKLHYEDYTALTTRSARRIYLLSVPGYPLYLLLNKFGIMSEIRTQNARSCRYQWLTRESGLWGHAMIWAEKPL